MNMINEFTLPWVAGPMEQLNTFFKGGSAPKPTPAPPPVTERQTEVQQAKRDTKLIMQAKKGKRASVLAGETGGYDPGVGTKSFLG